MKHWTFHLFPLFLFKTASDGFNTCVVCFYVWKSVPYRRTYIVYLRFSKFYFLRSPMVFVRACPTQTRLQARFEPGRTQFQTHRPCVCFRSEAWSSYRGESRRTFLYFCSSNSKCNFSLPPHPSGQDVSGLHRDPFTGHRRGKTPVNTVLRLLYMFDQASLANANWLAQRSYCSQTGVDLQVCLKCKY